METRGGRVHHAYGRCAPYIRNSRTIHAVPMHHHPRFCCSLGAAYANAENLVARIQNGGRIRVLQYALERYVKGEINRQGVCPKMAHAFFIEFPAVSISSCSDLFGLLFFSATIWA